MSGGGDHTRAQRYPVPASADGISCVNLRAPRCSYGVVLKILDIKARGSVYKEWCG